MTTLAIIALITWGTGLFLVALTAIIEYISAYDPDDRKWAARLIILSPLWPMLAIQLGKRIWQDAFGGDHDRA